MLACITLGAGLLVLGVAALAVSSLLGHAGRSGLNPVAPLSTLLLLVIAGVFVFSSVRYFRQRSRRAALEVLACGAVLAGIGFLHAMKALPFETTAFVRRSVSALLAYGVFRLLKAVTLSGTDTPI